MRRRLTLITEIIAPYRVPVFNALAARDDIDLHVLFLSHTDPSLRDWEVPLKEVCFSYEVLPSFRRRIGKYNLLLNRRVTSALERQCPDVILCGGYNYLASWRAAYWAKKRKIPFLLWVESTAADQRGKRAVVEVLKRRFLDLCCGFVVPGKSSAKYLEQFGIPENAIYRAPNAVDNQLFFEGAKKARADGKRLRQQLQLPDRYFLNVGRLVPAKGVFELLEAYAKLEGPLRTTIGLVFVGDGKARPELESRATQIAPGYVRVVGFVQKDQLAVYYALADAFIFPTRSDPWGLVVNEAMACSCPVIATDVAGCAADLVQDGRNGLVVPAGNPGKLSGAMQSLMSSQELRFSMGQRSLEQIAAFSPESCAAGIACASKVACGEQD